MEELKMVPVLWSRLPDIDDVEPVGELDGPVLDALKKVLKEHNALDRFGITLLHRHFSLADGEVLVESTNRETRTQTVEVRPSSEVFDGGRVLGTQWAFDGSNEQLVCRGWCHYDQGHKRHHQWSADPANSIKKSA